METPDENPINKIVFSDEVQSAIEQVSLSLCSKINKQGAVGWCDNKMNNIAGTAKHRPIR